MNIKIIISTKISTEPTLKKNDKMSGFLIFYKQLYCMTK